MFILLRIYTIVVTFYHLDKSLVDIDLTNDNGNSRYNNSSICFDIVIFDIYKRNTWNTLKITYIFTIILLTLIGILLHKDNLLFILFFIELFFLTISLAFLLKSWFQEHIIGELIAFFILTLVAVETALALSILISFYRISGKININILNFLKG